MPHVAIMGQKKGQPTVAAYHVYGSAYTLEYQVCVVEYMKKYRIIFVLGL